MTELVQKINSNLFKINDFYVSRNDKLWDHTYNRIMSFKKLPHDQFVKKMKTRLKATTHHDKLYYTIAVLMYMGEEDFAYMYDSKIIADIIYDM